MIVLDMDSSVSETHGGQEGSACNGHFGCTCHHPLYVLTSSATWGGSRFGPATCTAPMAGARCWRP